MQRCIRVQVPVSAPTKRKRPQSGAFSFCSRRRRGLEAPPPLLLLSLCKTVARWRRMPFLLAKCCCPSSKAFFKRLRQSRRKRGKRPIVRTNKKEGTQSGAFFFCLSKPQAWHIIECITRLRRDIHSYIISPFGAVSHHAPACIFLRLDDIQFVWY